MEQMNLMELENVNGGLGGGYSSNSHTDFSKVRKFISDVLRAKIDFEYRGRKNL